MTYKFQGVTGAKDGKLTGSQVKLEKQKTILSEVSISKENIQKLKKYLGIVNDCPNKIVVQTGLNKLLREI